MKNNKFVLVPEQPAAPALVCDVPGPKARDLIARDHA